MKHVILDDICISKPHRVLALHRPKLRIPLSTHSFFNNLPALNPQCMMTPYALLKLSMGYFSKLSSLTVKYENSVYSVWHLGLYIYMEWVAKG